MMELIKHQVANFIREKNATDHEKYELHMPFNIEMQLEKECVDTPLEYGELIRRDVFIKGVRGVFHHFFGISVVFDAKEFVLVEK